MIRLDNLLDRISEEDLEDFLSDNEIEFFEKSKILKKTNREDYVFYMRRYNEILEFKGMD